MSNASEPTTWEERFRQRFVPWAQRRRLTGKLAIALAVLGVIAGVATYGAWTGSGPFQPNPRLVLGLLVLDLVLLLSLGALIARQLVRLWVERRSGSAGSRLHTRFVALFSLVAISPAIVVAVFSLLFFYLGMQNWFSERVRTAVQGSLAVAEAYVDEHRNTIRADILAMAQDINRAPTQLLSSSEGFGRFLSAQTALRSLGEATVFDGAGRVLARTTLSLSAAFSNVPLGAIDRAASGDVVIFGGRRDDQVRALVRLERPFDSYLYVARFVDPLVLNHVESTRNVVREYEALEGSRSDLQITSALIFIVVALLLLLVAVWLGLNFANRLVQPIRALVETAEMVRQGDLSVRVREGTEEDEIGTLSRVFNRMTSQLENQREELVAANRQMDQRRRFTEAVLAGVSAGVLGLDKNGVINLPNQSAADLLEINFEELPGRRLADVVPEMAPMLDRARASITRTVEGQITFSREGHSHTFVVRVSVDRSAGDGRQGYVVTFDDVTDLVTAQRRAAWADVARRIAHEIKNPLTPIQLSAERLRRKYAREITSDPDIFEQCTDTIVRQVGDIGRMVDEFSAFARMPAAEMREEDICGLVREAVFAQQFAQTDIDFVSDIPAEPVPFRCDRRQVAQIMSNLLKNAVEAIDGRQADQDGHLPRGRVSVCFEHRPEGWVVEVADNGCGLPLSDRERLTEPYVTTREKGTGLGLAIVKKIVEEHGWRLRLEDAPEGGAVVRVVLGESGEAGDTVAADVERVVG